MKRKKDISSLKSFAGRFGAASRWANHKIKKTKLVRIYQDDDIVLSRLASAFGSVASVVHCSLVDSGYCNLSFSEAQARASKEL